MICGNCGDKIKSGTIKVDVCLMITQALLLYNNGKVIIDSDDLRRENVGDYEPETTTHICGATIADKYTMNQLFDGTDNIAETIK